MLEFESLFNVRDLGGLPTRDGHAVRHGVLYRADGVHRATGSDLERLGALGLRTVIDLRTHGELEIGRLGAEDLGAAWHHAPVLTEIWRSELVDGLRDVDAVPFLIERYIEMTDDGADAIAQAVEILAIPASQPVLFHCAAGKDRTGVLAAIVLGLLGVDERVIADDYARSAEAMQRAIAWFERNEPAISGAMTRQPRAFMEAPREVMVGFLDHLRDRFGSVGGYAQHIGLAPDVVDSLRASALEPRAA